MKHAEQAADRVLRGLRETEVPEGMERRIVETLAARVSEFSGWGGRRVQPIPAADGWARRGAIAAAGVVFAVLLFAGVSVWHRGWVPVQRIKESGVRARVTVPPAPEVARIAPVESERWRDVRSKSDLRGTKPGVRGARSRRAGAAASSGSDEARAVSFPAPPMPLTEQERLLLRVVHRGDPEEIAMLDPARRAARDADEKGAVQAFFEPAAAAKHE